MAILLKSLQLINAEKIHPAQDYLIKDGEVILAHNSSGLDSGDNTEEIDCTGLLGSAGWIDLRCMMGEPGLEYKETIQSLGDVLASSGFTKAVVMPNTIPALQSKNEIQYVKAKASKLFTELIIQAAATRDNKGEDFTEILDINNEGVFVFGDGVSPLSNPDRLMKILQYLQKFDGILFDHSYDPLLALFGQMHEGDVSTRVGMKGIPNLSEEIAIQRNIEILKYTGGRMHLQTISSAKSVDLIRQAKKDGLDITADVSIYQLIFSDADLNSFDANLKVIPPFRSTADRKVLIEGLMDGTIDAIVSNHQPQDFDSKHMEFDLASFGMIGIQSFLPAMVLLAEELTWPLLIQKITQGPAHVLKLENSKINNLTIFDPSEKWFFDQKSNMSLSKNTPWFGKELMGKVKYSFNGSQFKRI
ncbi:dihydroorotase [Belliella aquatica]|uniref:Dihydroorotase n=1 Tax=Belliella aquatica TaxID=1323734 RepID=A0ABQ1N4H5_9BACT|nr:dihydroorotase [Belliella aquatica]MCH7407456.1 dihydroorotase [Belliella aquatica]GGC53739.1 dihydroorotase [Belliella aquatica]